MWAIRSAAFAAVCLSSTTGVRARPTDWGTAVGGNGARTGLVDAVGPAQPDVLWSAHHPADVADPAVILGHVGVMARVVDLADRQHGTELIALDMRSGSLLWRVSLPIDALVSDWRVRVLGASGGLVFASRAGDSNASYLYALRIIDGSIAWRSADRISECSTESPALTDDGDLIIGNFSSLVRVRAADGSTAWTTPRSSPSSDGSAAAVLGRRAYIWEASPDGPRVTAFDADTGQRLYSSPALGKGYSQQMGLMVGPGPTVYAPRADNRPGTDALCALRDTGSALVPAWRVPIAYTPFSSMGIGPDGSVYAYAPGRTIVRLRADDGSVLASSQPLETDFFQPRMAIDAAGTLFVTNGGGPAGKVQAFTPDLQERWRLDVPGVHMGGPALGAPGVLLLCAAEHGVLALGNAQAECDLDWNADGMIDVRDLLGFFEDFFDGDADVNADGVTDSTDFFEFLNRFIYGC